MILSLKFAKDFPNRTKLLHSFFFAKQLFKKLIFNYQIDIVIRKWFKKIKYNLWKITLKNISPYSSVYYNKIIKI